MNSPVAIIDMGTNTFHLMIARKTGTRFEIIYRDREAVKIGKGGINNGHITEEGLNRALTALRKFKLTIDEHQVQATLAFGTSALRNAANRQYVCDEIKKATDIDVRIISGNEEAELIYKGVRAAVAWQGRALIIDIGGGSVEFIIADHEKVFWKASLEIGGQRLLELFHRHDPILPEEINALDNYLLEQLKLVFTKLAEFKPTTLVGSSGTFDTLSEMYCAEKGIPYHEEDGETPLTFESFHNTYQQLITKDRAQRMALPGMIELRVDMIVVAVELIRVLLEKYSFEEIRVSTYSLKEGALAELAN